MSLILRNSIFNNTTELNGFSYIHFPLIYKTACVLFMQMYADAVAELFKIMTLNNNIYFKTVDNLTVEFASKDKEKIHLYMINIFNDRKFLCKILKKLKVYSKELPLLFKEWEEDIKNGKKTSKSVFKKIYRIIVYFLAVNYSNCVTETYLPQYFKSQEADKYNNYLVENTFSHIKYFNEQKEKFSNDILIFAKNFGFLSNETGEPTEYEDCKFLSEAIGRKITPKEILSGKYIYPEINFDEEKIISNEMPDIVNLAKLLQASLEVRHYWQLRLARDMRIMINNDKTIINTWLYKDYEKKLFGI